MRTKKRTSTPPKAESMRQQPAQLGVILREGIVTALAGVFKVGAEVGRVAARATNDALDAAGRMTTSAGQGGQHPPRKTAPSRRRRDGLDRTLRRELASLLPSSLPGR
jgi:hypothetical protein